MVGIGIGIFPTAAPAATTSEYLAVLARATTLGYTKPSAAQQVKHNTMIRRLKDAGIWSRLDVFYYFAQDGGANFGTLNWKNPSANQVTLLNSPTFTSNRGFNGNGSTSYMNTNFNQATQGVNFTQNNASRFFGVATESSVGTILGGLAESLTHEAVANDISNDKRITQGGLNQASDMTGTGLMLITRVDANIVKHYKNGVELFSGTRVSAALTSGNYLLGRGKSTAYGNAQISYFGSGADLTTQQASLNTIMTDYLVGT